MKRFSFLGTLLLLGGGMAMTQDDSGDIFKTLDKNNDGKLVASEVPEEQRRFFDRLVRIGDDNDDGELSRSEYNSATSDDADRPGPPPGRGPEGRGAGGRPPGGLQGDSGEIFNRMDANKDGKLALDEVPEFLRNRMAPAFRELKKDAITLEEFTELRRRMSQDRQGQGRPGEGRSGAAGGEGRPSPEEMFKRMDRNGDGKVTASEVPEQAQRMIRGMLDRLGKGPDDALTADDIGRAMAQFRGAGQGDRPPGQGRPGDDRAPGGQGGGPAFFRILDTNRDGRLSREELSKAASLIDELDQNGDGQLEGRELFGGAPGGGRPGEGRPGEGRPRGEGDRPRRPDGEGRPGDRPQRPDGEGDRPRRPAAENDRPTDRQPRERASNLEENFRRLDENGDGAVSKDEAPERLKENFSRVDTNGDGKVTLEELRKVFERADQRRD